MCVQIFFSQIETLAFYPTYKFWTDKYKHLSHGSEPTFGCKSFLLINIHMITYPLECNRICNMGVFTTAVFSKYFPTWSAAREIR
jgi:coproporphyrinogen III oxidase